MRQGNLFLIDLYLCHKIILDINCVLRHPFSDAKNLLRHRILCCRCRISALTARSANHKIYLKFRHSAYNHHHHEQQHHNLVVPFIWTLGTAYSVSYNVSINTNKTTIALFVVVKVIDTILYIFILNLKRIVVLS